MTEIENNKGQAEDLVIDKQYRLQEKSKAIEIIKKGMEKCYNRSKELSQA